MAKLVIEGDKRQLEVIVRENRIRASRYSLKMTVEEPKSTKKVEPEVKQQAEKVSGKTTGKK